MGFGTKIFGGLSIALVIALAFMMVKNAKLEANNIMLVENVGKLEAGIDEQKATIKRNLDIVVASVKRESDLKKDLASSVSRSDEYKNEISRLRINENAKALQEPYKRGVAAGSRLKSLWMRIEGENDRNNDDTSSTETDDPPSTNN